MTEKELYNNIRDRFMNEIEENNIVSGSAAFRIIDEKCYSILIEIFKGDIEETVKYWRTLFSKVINRTNQEYKDCVITLDKHNTLKNIYLYLDIRKGTYSLYDKMEELNITPYWIIQTFPCEGKMIKTTY